VLYVRFHSGETGEEAYSRLLGLLHEITPVVQALPPDAALADVHGALRYFGRPAAELAALIRVRALARYGVDCTIGVGGNPLLARLAVDVAVDDGDPPGAVRAAPEDLDAVPAAALPGVGEVTARQLAPYGLDTVGRITATPLGTLQRILGAAAGRRIHDQAHGIDPAPVTPNAPARAMAGDRRFSRDELDPVRHRGALLSLTDELGARLRAEGQVARSLTLTVRYADRSTTTRTRSFPEPTAHTADLTATAYRLHASLGLQRARVRGIALRVEGLAAAELTARQLTFDPGDDKARRLEAAADRARARFGPKAVRPATLPHSAA
jgi:DNA polymerase-4